MDATTRAALRDALGDAVAFDAPLARCVSLRVGGPADALVRPRSVEQLRETLRLCRALDLPTTPLGGGFNTLPLDGGVEGVVVHLRSLREIEVRASGEIYAQAGVSHNTVVKRCIALGLGGLEFAAGIPGSVGGWIAMNAGIGEREMADALREVEVVRSDGSALERISGADLQPAYREMRGIAPGDVVVAGVFETSPSTSDAVRAEVDRLLARRAATQPLDVPSCGSVFKNPAGDHAGRLVEEAGLKGLCEKGARISEVHANFIANSGGATSADIVHLIERAREAVRDRSGIELETEVRIIGRPGAAESHR